MAAEVGKALQRNLLSFELFDVSQLHSAFTKQTFSHQQSNLSSEEGEKQFPLPILLNTHLFWNRFIMSPFAMRNVQSRKGTKQFIAHWLSSFLGSRQQYVLPGTQAPVLAAGKGWSHTSLDEMCFCVTNRIKASGVQIPCLQKMCQTALVRLSRGNPGIHHFLLHQQGRHKRGQFHWEDPWRPKLWPYVLIAWLWWLWILQSPATSDFSDWLPRIFAVHIQSFIHKH